MSKLEQNTTSLNEVLTKINNLPSGPSEVEQATPTITVSSDGLITATATQTAGYVSAGTKSATKQLTSETWIIEYENGSSEEIEVTIV